MANTATRAQRWKTKWLRAGEFAAHIVGIGVFAVLWVLVLAPTAILLKLSGKRLFPEWKSNATSYYLPKEPLKHTLEEVRRQW